MDFFIIQIKVTSAPHLNHEQFWDSFIWKKKAGPVLFLSEEKVRQEP